MVSEKVEKTMRRLKNFEKLNKEKGNTSWIYLHFAKAATEAIAHKNVN